MEYYNWRGLKFVFRRGPVPGIRHLHNTHRPYFRRPQTTQERRKWFDAIFEWKEYKFNLRYRRSSVNLPNAYSDIYSADNHTRCWKRTKKLRQWM
jgi:hypothetical protein